MEFHFYQLIFIIGFLITKCVVDSYNLDTDFTVLKNGLADTYFGFSVSQHKVGTENWLLVGAPQDNSDYIDVNNTGAVYRCSANSISTKCENQVKFDDQPIETSAALSNAPIESKTNQWFGVSLKSGGKDQPIISCAHRYTYFGTNGDFRLLEGRCWTVDKEFGDAEYFDVCRSKNSGRNTPTHEEYGQCESGASVDTFKETIVEGETIANYVVGAIGSKNFAGRTFERNSDAEQNEGDLANGNDDSYFGYAVVQGYFFKKDEYSVATGGPRHKSIGKVLLYSKQLKAILQELPDTSDKVQMSSGYGIAVAAVDSDNDGFVELIVGAPFHAKVIKHPNQGIVYVYKLEGDKLKLSTKLRGSIKEGVNSGRGSNFGYAVTNAGDINLDGFNDLVVGAPHEDGGNGAVYIYLGAKDGLKDKVDQHISASSIVSGLTENIGLKGFGRSLAGGLDLDDNGYNDVLVGAYSSNQAVLLRSRPVIDTFADIEFLPEELDVAKKGCIKRELNTTCFSMKFCFNFTEPSGKIYTAPDSKIPIRFTIQADPIAKRVRFDSGKNTYEFTGQAQTSKKTCEDVPGLYLVFNEEGRISVYPDVTFKVKYSLPYGSDGFDRPARSDTEVISLDTYPQLSDGTSAGIGKVHELSYKLKFKRECTKCVPNLVLNAPSNFTISLGQSSFLLNVTLANKGVDPAYSVSMKLIFPEDLQLENIFINSKREYCKNYTCKDIFYKFAKNEMANIDISIDARKFTAESMNKIKIIISSLNKEENDTLADNQAEVTFDLKVDADIEVLQGKSTQQVLTSGDIEGETAMRYLNDLGPYVEHKFVIRNNGPDLLPKAILKINWPLEVRSGKHLLYLVDAVATSSSTKCFTNKRNILNLRAKAGSSASALVASNSLRVRRDTDNSTDTTTDGGTDTKPTDATVTIDPSGEPPVEEVTDKKTGLLLNCKTAKCVLIECHVYDIPRDTTEVISVQSRLWQPTLLIDYYGEVLQIVSEADVSIGVNATYINDPNLMNNHVEIYTFANPVFPPKSQEKIAIWIIALAVIAGVILLAVLIFGLYKLGFFKRQRTYGETENDKADSALLGGKYKQ